MTRAASASRGKKWKPPRGEGRRRRCGRFRRRGSSASPRISRRLDRRREDPPRELRELEASPLFACERAAETGGSKPGLKETPSARAFLCKPLTWTTRNARRTTCAKQTRTRRTSARRARKADCRPLGEPHSRCREPTAGELPRPQDPRARAVNTRTTATTGLGRARAPRSSRRPRRRARTSSKAPFHRLCDPPAGVRGDGDTEIRRAVGSRAVGARADGSSIARARRRHARAQGAGSRRQSAGPASSREQSSRALSRRRLSPGVRLRRAEGVARARADRRAAVWGTADAHVERSEDRCRGREPRSAMH